MFQHWQWVCYDSSYSKSFEREKICVLVACLYNLSQLYLITLSFMVRAAYVKTTKSVKLYLYTVKYSS